MTEIAARAGASIVSLYQFFPKKQHIAGELHARFLDILAESLTDADTTARRTTLGNCTIRRSPGGVTIAPAPPRRTSAPPPPPAPDPARRARELLMDPYAGLLRN